MARSPSSTDGGVDLRTSENPREPVEPIREDGPKAVTPASGTLAKNDFRGHSVPEDAAEVAREREVARSKVAMRKVVILRDYWTVDNKRLSEGSEVEMPIEDARFLEESGIAQSADTYKKPAK